MAEKKTTKKNYDIAILDEEGKVVDKESLSSVIKEASPLLLAQSVRVFLSNQRKARAKTKNRAEVLGSKSKIYRQKGTGRARHGDRQAPIFVGGGVAHGPRGNQNYQLKINRKMKHLALAGVLLQKIKAGEVFIAPKVPFKKTKEAASFLKKVEGNLKLKKQTAFVVEKKEEIKKVLRNLPGVTVLNIESLNPYFVMKSGALILTPAAKKGLQKLC